MRASFALIVMGYVVLMLEYGWAGVLASVAHLAVLGMAVRR